MNANWLARLLTEANDYCCDVWYTFRPNVNEFWDTVAPKFRDLPGPVDPQEAAVAGEFHLMRICPVCGSHIGAPCTTADGKITGPHKRRRAA